jgi:hypothetical protein
LRHNIPLSLDIIANNLQNFQSISDCLAIRLRFTMARFSALCHKKNTLSGVNFWCEQSTSMAYAISPRNPPGSRPFVAEIKKPPDGGF